MNQTHRLRIALAQINPIVGDFRYNSDKILEYIQRAEKAGAQLILFPELALCGYPPEDLLLRPAFIAESQRYLLMLSSRVQEIIAVVGFANGRGGVYNAAAVLRRGRIIGIHHKIWLPNYGVFDEKRYFQSGTRPLLIKVNDIRIGINVCEDIWVPNGVAEYQAIVGNASLICNISASPYHANRRREREEMLTSRARNCGAHVAYVNMVGGQDELVFDGGSFVYSPEGELLARGPLFEEHLLVADIDLQANHRTEKQIYFHHEYQLEEADAGDLRSPAGSPMPPKIQPAPEELSEIYAALVLGTRDYVQKNGFRKVVIGLSGGIDSSLTAAIAVSALGKENVIGVLMPSRFTSRASLEDAERLAHNLGIRTYTLSIEAIVQQYEKELAPVFEGRERDITEENLQARARGNILMALSNKFDWLVLTTGNKSETSVGYCTLYGDMAGGFAVLKDVLKTKVYQLAEFVNREREIIPQRVLEKPPSAELRPDQKDEDSLPPYAILDRILAEYVERDRSINDIIAMGFDEPTVKEVARLVDRNEYKRRQAPPGIRITPKAFGRDWRMPITNHFTNMVRE
ncbi:MAG: NAD+ synthase [candidate division KSB1 bacterium]|nr:NAD+ synthase [candidate division KSB1 bacterium]MDQ7065163.1 NAD+ synthase [candidate division KSB1 bacterium]